MLNIDDVKEYLQPKFKDIISDIRLRPSDEMILIYISQEKIASKAYKGAISTRQINSLKKDITEKLKLFWFKIQRNKNWSQVFFEC